MGSRAVSSSLTTLASIEAEVVECRQCPRLVAWREEVASTKRAAFADETYWGRPVPGFGDPAASVLIMGLAPAAHGANRTGRMFTGDRSGEWLYRAMHRAGLANQAESIAMDDGLELSGAWVTSPVKCAPPANKPTSGERTACEPFLQRELTTLEDIRVVVGLGAFGFAAAARAYGMAPLPKFGHGVEVELPGGAILIGSYHVSQQNTFTGRLTEPMLDDVFSRAVAVAAAT